MSSIRSIYRSLAVFCGILLLSLQTYAAAPIKVGIVLDKGGKDDKSFNSAAHAGLEQAIKQLGISGKYIEAADDNSFEPLLRNYAKKDFDLIIAVGFAQAEALKKVAPLFPKKHFAIVDAEVNAPNVRSLMFEEHEGSYLAGALAAMKTKNNKIGFVGGMDIPLIRRFLVGYEAGAKAINPKINVVTNYVGVTGDSWNNPAKAKELAIAQIQGGAQIIFAVAGASNMGVFDAAEEKKAQAIGVDSNQNWIKPGIILTSMLKRVDVAVYKTIEDAKNGKFPAGLARFGLANDGVGIIFDKDNDKLVTAADKQKIEKLKADIIAGKIKVPATTSNK
jgi:basic membrane protein A